MTNIDDNFKSKGFIPSTLLWILYGFNLRVAWHLFSGVPFYLLLTWDLELVLAYIMSVVAVGHMLLSVIYLIIGGFQLHAIIKKKASSFIKLSFAVNIITFGIGLLASWLFNLILLIH